MNSNVEQLDLCVRKLVAVIPRLRTMAVILAALHATREKELGGGVEQRIYYPKAKTLKVWAAV